MLLLRHLISGYLNLKDGYDVIRCSDVITQHMNIIHMKSSYEITKITYSRYPISIYQDYLLHTHDYLF